MGRKRKSEISEPETTPAVKVVSSPESRRSSDRIQAKKGATPVVVPVDLADSEKKGSLEDPNGGKPSNGEVAETNVGQGASKVPVMNCEQVITEKNVEHGSSQIALLNTELDKTTTGEKLNSAMQRIKELSSKDGMTLDAGPSDDDICYKILYRESQQKVEELMVDNLALKEKLSFEQGRVATYQETNDNMSNLLKGAISSQGQANETQTPKRKYTTKKGNDNSSLEKANETQPSKQKKETKKGNDKSTPGKANEGQPSKQKD